MKTKESTVLCVAIFSLPASLLASPWKYGDYGSTFFDNDRVVHNHSTGSLSVPSSTGGAINATLTDGVTRNITGQSGAGSTGKVTVVEGTNGGTAETYGRLSDTYVNFWADGGPTGDHQGCTKYTLDFTSVVHVNPFAESLELVLAGIDTTINAAGSTSYDRLTVSATGLGGVALNMSSFYNTSASASPLSYSITPVGNDLSLNGVNDINDHFRTNGNIAFDFGSTAVETFTVTYCPEINGGGGGTTAGFGIANISYVVPEPTSISLVGLGSLGLLLRRKRA